MDFRFTLLTINSLISLKKEVIIALIMIKYGISSNIKISSTEHFDNPLEKAVSFNMEIVLPAISIIERIEFFLSLIGRLISPVDAYSIDEKSNII